MKRKELKYFIRMSESDKLMHLLDEACKLDEYGKYHVSSIYCDTMDYRFAEEAIRNPTFCSKYRVRKYGTRDLEFGDTVYVEKKMRQAGHSLKERELLVYGKDLEIIAGRIFFSEGKAKGSSVLKELSDMNLRPKLRIDYARRCFMHKNESRDVRITVDERIKCRPQAEQHDDLNHWLHLNEDFYLIEVKFAETMPTWTERIIKTAGLHLSDYSKYVSSYRCLRG